jgi:hypothetical protein
MCAISSWRSGLVSADVSWGFTLLGTLIVFWPATESNTLELGSHTVIRRRILTEPYDHYALRARRKRTPKPVHRGFVLRRVILDAASNSVAAALRALCRELRCRYKPRFRSFCWESAITISARARQRSYRSADRRAADPNVGAEAVRRSSHNLEVSLPHLIA